MKLTSHEFRVLSYLMHHGGRVVSRTELTEHIYAQDLDRDSNTVEVFIARLRRKLGASLIETVRGLGIVWGTSRLTMLRSLRSRLILASVLWTAGLLALIHMLALVTMHVFPGVAHSLPWGRCWAG